MARAGQGGEDEKGWRGVEEGGRRKGAGREGGRERERERERERNFSCFHTFYRFCLP